MIPCLKSFGGNCQDTVMLVELLAVAVKLLGAFEGTAKLLRHFGIIIFVSSVH